MPSSSSRPSKKRKTTNTTTTNNDISLSQAEIWDDSALQRSWNDAVREYEYYHSLAVSGEDVEEVLRRAEEGEGSEDVEDGRENGVVDGGRRHVGKGRTVESEVEIHEEEDGGVQSSDEEEGEIDENEGGSEGQERADIEGKAEVSGPAVMVNEVVSGQGTTINDRGRNNDVAADQTLENIKMAYYWAGYYSGLYDGQQRGSAGGS